VSSRTRVKVGDILGCKDKCLSGVRIVEVLVVDNDNFVGSMSDAGRLQHLFGSILS
jgi:hypothetical protein